MVLKIYGRQSSVFGGGVNGGRESWGRGVNSSVTTTGSPTTEANDSQGVDTGIIMPSNWFGDIRKRKLDISEGGL